MSGCGTQGSGVVTWWAQSKGDLDGLADLFQPQ